MLRRYARLIVIARSAGKDASPISSRRTAASRSCGDGAMVGPSSGMSGNRVGLARAVVAMATARSFTAGALDGSATTADIARFDSAWNSGVDCAALSNRRLTL
jgi:hypothetical protein